LHRHRLLLRRCWWAIILILAGVLAPVYLFTAAQAPRYVSKARMWLSGKISLSENRLYTEELVNYLGTQVELLGSPTVQRRALARMEARLGTAADSAASGVSAGSSPLAEAKRFLGGLMGREPGGTNAEPAFPFKVKVQEGAKSSILELRASGADPERTRVFLDCLMEEYLKFKKEVRERASDRTVDSVTEEVARLANELKVQQEKLHAFQMSNNVVFLQEQGSSAGGYLAQINRQLAMLRTELQLLQRIQPEQLIGLREQNQSQNQSRGSEGSAPQAGTAASQEMLANLAGPQAELFRASQQIGLLKARRVELARFLQAQHPKMIKLDEEIATQEKVMQIARDEALKQLVHRRELLQLEIRNLEEAFEEWDAKALEASRKMVNYDRIRQDLQRFQAAYDRLLGVIQTVDAGKKLDQENMSILEPASAALPGNPLARNLVLALVGSSLLAFGFVYVAGRFDDRFASLTELSNHLDEEVIGQIPDIALKRQKGPLSIESLEAQRFEFVESFRNIRSSLLFTGGGAARPKSLLVAGSVPREGKSTVALHLAAIMAMSGSRVLLIDADMRRATLHKFFKTAAAPGLAEILNGEMSWEKAVQVGKFKNLSFLPGGTATRNPGELVLQPEWACLLRDVSPHFDYIVVDSPPILATDDAASLGPQVDGVLFVVRGSYTSARMARKALDTLRKRRARVLGLVFNRAASSAYDYHSYQRYRSSYSWSPRPSKRAPELAAAAMANSKTR
jgi:capsular exopolysaccharide synthesis family protein